MKNTVCSQIFVYFIVSAVGKCTRNGKSAVGDFHVEAAAAVGAAFARQNFALFFKRGLVVVGDGRDVGLLRRSKESAPSPEIPVEGDASSARGATTAERSKATSSKAPAILTLRLSVGFFTFVLL